VIAAFVAELRVRGIELHPNGTTLRVFGPPGVYSPSLRARLLALKPDILEHLRREQESAATSYEREERAWAAEYVTHLALARGYSEELARIAAAIVVKRPVGAPFRVDRDVIVIAMGEGVDVRVHRLPQSWISSSEKESAAVPATALGSTTHTLGPQEPEVSGPQRVTFGSAAT
jgi:hypothetical protein